MPDQTGRPSAPHAAPRSAIVDLGSNSVRLVVFEGRGRNPVAIFNEKAVLRLGRGLSSTGRLNEAGVSEGLRVMARYNAIARAMGANPFEVLATAAVRDASNGPEFVAALQARMPGVPIRVLSGEQEAAMSSAGVLCGIPEADGIMADIGGGSLEVVRVGAGAAPLAESLGLGVIRLSDRAEGDLARARIIADADIGEVPWLPQGEGRDLYLVGGAWRALARVQMHLTNYPLHIVHHYTITRDAGRDLAAQVLASPRRVLERLTGAPRRRVDDLPFAATVLRRLLRGTGARRVVFSANGVREGWYMQHVPPEARAADPVVALGHDTAARYGRDVRLPPALLDWTAPLFPEETPEQARLRTAACWMSDIGSHDHPDYRAEQAFLRVLRQPGVAMDHPTRAFLALTLALRYEAELDAPYLAIGRALLDPGAVGRAEVLGTALRLAYTLSAGTPELLAGAALRVLPGRLRLQLAEDSGVFAGEGVQRRLVRRGAAMGLAVDEAA